MLKTEALHPDAMALLLQSGWHPERDMSAEVERLKRDIFDPEGFILHDEAHRALNSLLGLTVHQSMPGITQYRPDIMFEPEYCSAEQDRFEDFGEEIGSAISPLGWEKDSYYLLGIAADGRCFALMNHLVFQGSTLEDALNNMLRGIKPSQPF
ncbi:MAG: SUKH-3 domain-containing protein [Bradymonadia bacterium]